MSETYGMCGDFELFFVHPGPPPYANNELAEFYLPAGGRIRLAAFDVEEGDSLMLSFHEHQDSAAQDMGKWKHISGHIDSQWVELSRSGFLRWQTNFVGVKTGWTVVYEPEKPRLMIQRGSLIGSSNGFALAATYYDFPESDNYEQPPTGENARSFVQTEDWVMPTVGPAGVVRRVCRFFFTKRTRRTLSALGIQLLVVTLVR